MISKKSKGTGASGGNGMQSYSIDYLMECDVYYEYKGGHVATCLHCGEDYQLEPKHNQIECLKLIKVMRDQGCPFCNHKGPLTTTYLAWYQEHKKKFLHLDFEIEPGQIVKAYHKPNDWKPITKAQLKDAWDIKEAK